jgi:hypothetical protein
MEDASLYRRVVVEGVRFVSDHTIERDTERMMALVEEHFGRSFKKRDPHREGS